MKLRSAAIGGSTREAHWLPLPMGLVPTLLAVPAGLAFAVMIPVGLPGDEPSHIATTTLVASSHALPILGHDGVTYEAQQTPLAYAIGAVVVGAMRLATPSNLASAYALRVLNGLEWIAALSALGAIVRLLAPTRFAGLCALGCLTFAPIYLAVGWSVNNDALSLALAWWGLVMLLRWWNAPLPDRGDERQLLGIGLLAGLAILAKLTTFPFAVVAVLACGFRERRFSARRATLILVPILALTSWWFVRNLMVYQALLPPTHLGGGPSFPAYGLHGPGTIRFMLVNVTTYLWAPTEYFRNTLHLDSPTGAALAGLTGLLAACGLVGLARYRRIYPLPSGLAVVMALSLFGAAIWGLVFIVVSAIAPRTLYVALPGWLLLLAYAPEAFGGRLKALRVSTSLVVPTAAVLLSAWTLVHVHDLPHFAFEVKR